MASFTSPCSLFQPALQSDPMRYIDLRSDTVTWPTPAMRAAMAQAPVGDDVYGDDPTVNELESYAATLVGKEASLFVPSGTFGNQLALFTWCPRGSEVLLGEECHIIQHEAGAASVISGVQTRCLSAPDGVMDSDAVTARIRKPDIHHPETSLICVENAHSSGRVVPLEAMNELYAIAKQNKLPVHLDGARIFNAAVVLGTTAAVIAERADSVMFCLSKGLCAPIGSMLAGNAAFIAKARAKRKLMGGGMRQAGILAAAGLIALKEMTGRVADDHRNARYLAKSLEAIPGLKLDHTRSDINMVFFRVASAGFGESAPAFIAGLKQRGVLINGPDFDGYRLVTHYWIGEKQIDQAVKAIREVLMELHI